jgi:hypothetical protein
MRKLWRLDLSHRLVVELAGGAAAHRNRGVIGYQTDPQPYS